MRTRFGLKPGDLVDGLSDNVHIVTIADAIMECATQPPTKIGDRIDRGLIALRLLSERGYGVVYLGPEAEEVDDG